MRQDQLVRILFYEKKKKKKYGTKTKQNFRVLITRTSLNITCYQKHYCLTHLKGARPFNGRDSKMSSERQQRLDQNVQLFSLLI